MRTRFIFDGWQRKGILGLILILIALTAFSFWHNGKYSSDISMDSLFDEQIQKQIDSLKELKKSSQNQQTIFPFNPNYLTDYRAYILGIKPEEFDRLQEFRAQNNWINSAEDFQKVTGISDSLLGIIAPYFKFPEWVTQSKTVSPQRQSNRNVKPENKKDLNLATEDDLKEINGIGEVLSQRIIRYRTQIGGFLDDIQLKDIYGLNFETRTNLLNKFTVQNPPVIEKKDLNKAEVTDLLEMPYLNYELARKIVHFRITREGIKDFEELAEIQGFPYEKLDRIQLYLKIENPD